MKTLFQKEAYDEMISRLNKLQANSDREWGKMNVAQMMAHCSACLDMATGKVNPPRSFMGRLIGGMIKESYVGPHPLKKGSPTAKELIMSDPKEFAKEKEALQAKITQFYEGGEANCTKHPHTFFGHLTPAEWAVSQYKHIDHHFRQFGV
jgi:hypothetical protein